MHIIICTHSSEIITRTLFKSKMLRGGLRFRTADAPPVNAFLSICLCMRTPAHSFSVHSFFVHLLTNFNQGVSVQWHLTQKYLTLARRFFISSLARNSEVASPFAVHSRVAADWMSWKDRYLDIEPQICINFWRGTMPNYTLQLRGRKATISN